MKKKVLHITKMKGIAGSENHLLTLLLGLDCERFDLHFYILAESAYVALLEEYKKTLERAGITVRVLSMRKYGDPLLLLNLWALIRQERFDIVHTHLIHADFYGTLAAKLAGVPAIICSRHNDDRFRHYRVLIWLNRMLARWHTKIIVISAWVGTFLQEVEGIPGEKIVCIHYGLEPESLQPYIDSLYARQQLGVNRQTPVFGTIGRLTAQKGQTYLLRALAKVKESYPAIRLVIIGDGELRTELEQQAKSLDIEQNVKFTGWQDRDDALRWLSGFDFFVFPSVWEGFGLVLLEAMAFKKAIVASRVSAIPELIVDGDTGVLVSPEDADSLAEAITHLVEKQELAVAMGKQGYQHLQNHFTVAKMVEATTSVYLSINK